MGKQANELSRKKEDVKMNAKKGAQDRKRNTEGKAVQAEDPPKLSPAEVWKNAAKIINTKKKEISQAKRDEICRNDLVSINEKLHAWAARKRDELVNTGADLEDYQKAQLENALRFYDDILDFRKSYVPKVQFEAPLFFPKEPLCVFECPEIYKKLDIDTLFYIFYTERSTLHQYFATRVLKSRSWRFHTKYKTWFQRLEEPRYITEDYEQGSYMFFDYDTTWTIRKKTDFTFEYKYLENTEV